MLPHAIFQLSLYYLSSSRRLKTKETFKPVARGRGRGRLREVVSLKSFQI